MNLVVVVGEAKIRTVLVGEAVGTKHAYEKHGLFIQPGFEK